MVFFIAFFTILVGALIWIRVDTEFATVPSWVWTLREPFNRGCDFKTYGTRAILFCIVVVSLVLIAGRITLMSPILSSLLAISAIIALFVSIPICSRMQRRDYLESLVHGIEKRIDLLTFFDTRRYVERLDYQCSRDWCAWQINDPNDLTPINLAYVRQTGGCIVFGVDWQDFLCWNASSDLRTGSLLPFDGSLDSKFTVSRRNPVRNRTDWTVLECDIVLPQEV